jgi:hypothetical protein
MAKANGKGSDRKEPQTFDANGEPVTPPVRRIDLSTLRDVRLELAALYRRVDSGDLESSDGTKRAYILTSIAKVIELAEIESRIEALEERQGVNGSRALPNAMARH